jgi:crossover junction endodeoxyribonuclease RusA
VNPTEFVIPERPLSVQAKDRADYQAWKQFIVLCALPHWRRAPVTSGEVRLTIVFLCDDSAPIDVDNVIKPIQDALLAVAYSDDVLVTDVDSHRRYLQDPFDITNCSATLIKMVSARQEAVYVRIQEADILGTYL